MQRWSEEISIRSCLCFLRWAGHFEERIWRLRKRGRLCASSLDGTIAFLNPDPSSDNESSIALKCCGRGCPSRLFVQKLVKLRVQTKHLPSRPGSSPQEPPRPRHANCPATSSSLSSTTPRHQQRLHCSTFSALSRTVSSSKDVFRR